MEEQCAARGAERQVAQFVEDHEIKLCKAFGKLSSLPLGLLLFERVDQLDGREEADLAAVMFDGLHAKGCRDMGFSDLILSRCPDDGTRFLDPNEMTWRNYFKLACVADRPRRKDGALNDSGNWVACPPSAWMGGWDRL